MLGACLSFHCSLFSKDDNQYDDQYEYATKAPGIACLSFACVNFLVFTLGLEAAVWDLAHTGDHSMVLTDQVIAMLARF